MAEANMSPMLIRAVLFDFDGTLTEPGSLDFDVIRGAIGCPRNTPVLEYVRSLASETERLRALAALDGFETDAAHRSRPNAAAEEILTLLLAWGLRIGILSRNSRNSILTALHNFARIRPEDFSVILSRDDPYAPKPSPDGILAAAHLLAVPVQQVLVVGDFVFDIEAGHDAGAITAFLTNRSPSHPGRFAPDFVLEHLGDLAEIVTLHAPLACGKLPNDLLERFLASVKSDASTLIVPPAVGEDVAALALPAEEILVLTSDPITYATDAAGRYAVTVNVNDVATSGATPRWLLATMLFPPGTNALQIRSALEELHSSARARGLIVCGGHTEITDAVTRPVFSVQVAGTVAGGGLIEKRNMASGHRVLMTKRLAVEGTSILAREFGELLTNLGVRQDEMQRCRDFLHKPGISILQEARLAAQHKGISAMHDITEGGVATALVELSQAGGHRIRVHPDRIPVYPETAKLCRLLGLNPLGLIASGSLLITCRPEAEAGLLAALTAAGVEAATIGEVLEKGAGVEAVDKEGAPSPWTSFTTDEIARLFRRPRTQVSSPEGT